ncbi:MAG: 16S rRNA (guanine(527)-N(7))-methyltransferase RsmG [Candidatus Puniceispirillales bacterium]
MVAPLSAEEACDRLDVSRETRQRLEIYVALLKRWQRSINLVSTATLDDVWRRHILDSGQVFRHLSRPHDLIMDIGSGAGLPGLVLAIMGAGGAENPLSLVESDERKCAFLAVAARECGISVKIRNTRLERLEPLRPAVITSRALAPLERLLDWTRAQHHPDLECLFLKGGQVDQELTCLANYPNINMDRIPSLSSPEGVLLKLTGFDHHVENKEEKG